jgi:hypothetical protein
VARNVLVAALAAAMVISACGGANPVPPSDPVGPVVAAQPTAIPTVGTQSTAGAIPPAATSIPFPDSPSVTPRPSAPPQPPQSTPTPHPTPDSQPEPKPAPTYDPNAPKADPNWQGQYSIYRARTHSVQKTDWYCVPTSIQMMLNLINGDSDKSEANQRRYWEYAQAHSRYPLRDNGADPQGWVAAMEHWGVPGYSVGVSGSMQDALWLAAKRLRMTNRPVGLIVWGNNGTGGHAWVMTGFESTDDPRQTDNYAVTAVQAMGSLWPYGTINGRSFDPGPKQWVGYRELRQKFPRLSYPAAPAWDGKWITVLP